MARIIGIDYGTKRVGVAVTDPLQLFPSPLDTYHANDILDFLKSYMASEEVETIVVGLPFRSDGSDTDSTPHIRKFIVQLEKQFPDINIETVDESFTSAKAMQMLIAGGAKKSKRREKGMLDKVSASIILQEYLDSL